MWDVLDVPPEGAQPPVRRDGPVWFEIEPILKREASNGKAVKAVGFNPRNAIFAAGTDSLVSPERRPVLARFVILTRRAALNCDRRAGGCPSETSWKKRSQGRDAMAFSRQIGACDRRGAARRRSRPGEEGRRPCLLLIRVADRILRDAAERKSAFRVNRRCTE